MHNKNTRSASKAQKSRQDNKVKTKPTKKAGRSGSRDYLAAKSKARKAKARVQDSDDEMDEGEASSASSASSAKKSIPMTFEKREQHSDFQDSPLNVSSKISFKNGTIYEYRRTSTKKGEDDLYHHHLVRSFDHNTVFAHGVSAFNREDMFLLVKFLLNNGSRNFTVRVLDETRFARNTVTCLKIYDILRALKTTFTLEIDGVKYDFVRDYFSHLRERFIESEGSSLEKSRISKKSYAARKGAYKNKKVLRDHFINMMFVIADKCGMGGVLGVKDIVMETGMRSLNTRMLNKHFEKNKTEIGKLKRKKKYTYAKCATSGHYFTVPSRLAKRDDLFFKVMGFGGDSVMKEFFKEWMSLNYLCCSVEEMEGPVAPDTSQTQDQEAGPASTDEPGENLNMDEVKWLVELYHTQHQTGEISIDELTDRMGRLFNKSDK
jgi:hypothetical protein